MDILIIASGIIDYKYRQIPNFIILMIFVWALLFSSASCFERIAGLLVTAVPLFVLALDFLPNYIYNYLAFSITSSTIPYSFAWIADIKLSLSVSFSIVSNVWPVLSLKILFNFSLVFNNHSVLIFTSDA